jgi:hypothetical protein
MLTAGTRIGAYEIERSLGAGGMGEVYRARDTRLNRTVAIKVLPPEFASDRERRARFDREAKTLSQIDHPHICALYDVGSEAGNTFLVMQFLDGETLAARLARGRLTVDHALTIGIAIASALDAAHRHGIVHRDLKPANIMLTKTGARLLDFGIARHAGVVEPRADATLTSPAGVPLTGEGALVGTLHYMSPEQLKGREADARSDIFSLGVVLYEMLAGRRPFDAAETATLIASILEHEPAPLARSAGIPPRLARAVEAAVDKDPDERWQSARDLLRELRSIVEEQGGDRTAEKPTAAAALSRRTWLIGAFGMLIVAAGVGMLVNRSAPAAAPSTPRIVLMDSPHPARVYDPATLRSGGTNADDLTELLQDLPVVLVKETTGSTWRREEQIAAENPAIVVVHRSCFYDSTLLPEPTLNEKYVDQLYQPAADKLEVLLGYLALARPSTRFIVYSRGSWETEATRDAWAAMMERRFPRLKGRLIAYKVPLDRATFRNAETGKEIRAHVVAALTTWRRAEAQP